MSTGEIISIIAVCISFFGVASAFIFSFIKGNKDRDKERDENTKNIVTIKNDITNILNNLSEIKRKIDKIEDRADTDHEKIIEHESRIKNLEKEVFNNHKKIGA